MSFQPRDYQTLFRMLGDPSLYQKYQIPSNTQSTHREQTGFSPNFDVYETPNEYVLEGELPGLHDKSKVQIEFTDAQTLHVRGRIEKSHEQGVQRRKSLKPTVEDEEEAAKEMARVKKEADKTKFWVSERSVGEFQRNFSFPGAVDLDLVKASLEHGILKIVVPKKVQAGSRKIEIS
ncbi:HSP20-like chaperone [Morchella snyderi]|nr:HSP20-like chaperone [Morchella snyderi]